MHYAGCKHLRSGILYSLHGLSQILYNPYAKEKKGVIFNPKKVYDFELNKTLDEKVFAAALCVFFLANNRWNSGQDQAVYMDMEAASLPSITVQMLGRDMNRLYGYRQEMNTTAAGENLTILPEDRALTVDITGGGVTGISYEVRSMDRERLVERTEVSDWQQTQQGIAATLPIQNLLTKEREYQLIIQLDTENYGSVYYYTRILWTDSAQHARGYG